MEATAELQTKLRRLIDEAIPADKTDASTRFTNIEINDLLLEHDNINAAAAEGWELKSGRVFGDRGGITTSTAGDETTKWVDPDKFAAHCLAQAALFRAKVPGPGGASTNSSRVFAINYPLPPGISE